MDDLLTILVYRVFPKSEGHKARFYNPPCAHKVNYVPASRLKMSELDIARLLHDADFVEGIKATIKEELGSGLYRLSPCYGGLGRTRKDMPNRSLQGYRHAKMAEEGRQVLEKAGLKTNNQPKPRKGMPSVPVLGEKVFEV